MNQSHGGPDFDHPVTGQFASILQCCPVCPRGQLAAVKLSSPSNDFMSPVNIAVHTVSACCCLTSCATPALVSTVHPLQRVISAGSGCALLCILHCLRLQRSVTYSNAGYLVSCYHTVTIGVTNIDVFASLPSKVLVLRTCRVGRLSEHFLAVPVSPLHF